MGILPDTLWKKSQTDRMLDLYFGDTTPYAISVVMQRTEREVKTRLERFIFNTDGRAERYEPFRRTSRKSRPLMKHELQLIKEHTRLKVSPEVTAKLLQRPVDDFQPDLKGRARVNEQKSFSTTLDLVCAYRHIFHHYHLRVISDKEYDDLKAEELEFGGGSSALAGLAVPDYIKSLALYLADKYLAEHPEKAKK